MQRFKKSPDFSQLRFVVSGGREGGEETVRENKGLFCSWISVKLYFFPRFFFYLFLINFVSSQNKRLLAADPI